jgi:hypothetical protein
MRKARQVAKARASKLLIVDASVMRAAGGEEATDPTPANARDTLKAILDICHRVRVSEDLLEEWKRHRSRFARRWLTQMYARRKVVDGEPLSCEHLVEDIRLFHLTTLSDIEAVEKDIHLVAVALATPDRTVLSWDNRVAAVIRRVCVDTRTVTSRAIASMLWIDPIADHAPLRAWLSETGPPQSHWLLGFVPDPVKGRSRNRSRQ